jgi:hypothetical protein
MRGGRRDDFLRTWLRELTVAGVGVFVILLAITFTSSLFACWVTPRAAGFRPMRWLH